MKSPTKRIFYHFGVTRSAFGTSTFTTTPILARYQHIAVPARTCSPASLPSARTCPPASLPSARTSAPAPAPAVDLRIRRRPTHPPARTRTPMPGQGAQKSLVAERYQAFSEAKSLS